MSNLMILESINSLISWSLAHWSEPQFAFFRLSSRYFSSLKEYQRDPCNVTLSGSSKHRCYSQPTTISYEFVSSFNSSSYVQKWVYNFVLFSGSWWDMYSNAWTSISKNRWKSNGTKLISITANARWKSASVCSFFKSRWLLRSDSWCLVSS